MDAILANPYDVTAGDAAPSSVQRAAAATALAAGVVAVGAGAVGTADAAPRPIDTDTEYAVSLDGSIKADSYINFTTDGDSAYNGTAETPDGWRGTFSTDNDGTVVVDFDHPDTGEQARYWINPTEDGAASGDWALRNAAGEVKRGSFSGTPTTVR